MIVRFEPFKAFDPASGFWGGRQGRSIPVDVYRRGDEYKVHLDLPGVDPSSVEVTVDHDVLTVRATRTWEPQETDQIQITERPRGQVSRRLLLGESLDREHLTASYENGVLTVTIPVAQLSKPRRVEITRPGEPQAVGAEGASAEAEAAA